MCAFNDADNDRTAKLQVTKLTIQFVADKITPAITPALLYFLNDFCVRYHANHVIMMIITIMKQDGVDIICERYCVNEMLTHSIDQGAVFPHSWRNTFRMRSGYR